MGYHLVPTILARNGFRVRVLGPPREHPPPHVHVTKGKVGLVIIRLPLDESPPLVWKAYDMKRSDILRAYRLIEDHSPLLLAAWMKLHG